MRTESLIFSQLMSNEEYSRKVLPHVREEYFASDEDKIFFKIYSRYFQKHNCIPSRQAMFVEIENLKGSVDIYKSLIEVTKETETFTENLQYLIDTTEKFCKERAVYNALREAVLIADGQDKKKTADAIPSILQSALSVCFDTAVGHDYIEDSDARYEYYHAAEAKIPTGVREFDKVTKGGFSRKTLNLILAPPHGGKSLIMVNMGCGALLAGFDVLFITLEMSDMEMSRRFDVNLMDVDFDTLDSLPKDIYKNKFSQVVKKSQGKLIVKEYPTGAAHAGHFKALLEELKTKQNFKPDLIIVDYMGICTSEKYKAAAGANSYTIGKSVSEELRALAVENNMAVISAIQTNRAGINNSSIEMTEISESIGSAMTADMIAAIINTDELKALKQIMIKLIKNRYAGLGYDKFLLGVDYNKMKLFDLEESSVKFTPKKTSKIETAADTFFDKPKPSAFDGFSFD